MGNTPSSSPSDSKENTALDNTSNTKKEDTRKSMVAKDLNHHANQEEQILITNAVLVVEEEEKDNHPIISNSSNKPPPVNPMYVPNHAPTTSTTNTISNFLPWTMTYPTSSSSSSPTTSNTMTIMNHSKFPTNTHGSNFMPVATNSNNNTAMFYSPIIYNALGRNPQGMICPHCHRHTVTVVRDFTGVGTIAAVVVIAIFFWPLCWIPFCIPSCHRTNHYCGQPSCQKKIGETQVCA